MGYFSYIDRLNSVDVIDNSTNTVVATIPIVSVGPGAVVNSRTNATRVYVGDALGNIQVIDTASNTVIDTIPIGGVPWMSAVSPDGTRLYVLRTGASDALITIDTSNNTIIDTLLIPGGPGLAGIVVKPDNSLIYISDDANNVVYEVNAGSLTITDTITVGTTPESIDITPDGAYIYVPNLSDDTVSVIRTSDNTVISTIPVGSAPRALAVTLNGLFVYVTNGGSNNVSVISTASNTVVDTIAVGTSPRGIAVQPDGAFVYVTNFGSSNVSVIATASNTVVDTIAVGASPNSLGYFIGFVAPPQDLIVTKSFSPSSIAEGETSTLTITVENPNASAVNNVSFNDVYPAGLINATPANASADIGTPVAADGGNSLSWSIATLNGNTTATITVNVTSSTAGTYSNDTGTVTGDEASSAGATADLTVTASSNGGGKMKPGFPVIICVNKRNFPLGRPTVISYGRMLYAYSHTTTNCYCYRIKNNRVSSRGYIEV